jgi:mono/diheme cytochrome c family protein
MVAAAAIFAASIVGSAQGPGGASDRTRTTSGGGTFDPTPVLAQYCVTCHNERLKTGGFVLDPSGAHGVASSAESWEKVVRKLRAQSMPPAGMPRPDAATYEALAAYLETELDRAAAAQPQLGNVPPVHRLSRTEYRNAIRDLLALDALPREISVDYLLPPDNISSGFDNIADLLFVSPSTMERYLDAARKISRLAVGDPATPVLVNIHRIDEERPQDERVDDLPFGTRGGVAVRSDFPVDGSYTIKVELAGAAREPHQIEITLDGERVNVEQIGGEGAGGGGRRGGGGGARAVPRAVPRGAARLLAP